MTASPEPAPAPPSPGPGPYAAAPATIAALSRELHDAYRASPTPDTRVLTLLASLREAYALARALNETPPPPPLYEPPTL